MTALTVFILSYIGIALGKIPGLSIDRVGVALLGAIGMVIFGVVTLKEAVGAVDYPTMFLLYALMIVSAQLRLGGFYTLAAQHVAGIQHRPRRFLMVTMGVSGLLSAVLANDIVCFAFTPVLAAALKKARLNPLPYLLGLAVSSNIGSAATLIGNPQNMLIGQSGNLDFAAFFLWCAPPSLLSMAAAYLLLLYLYRGRLHNTEQNETENVGGPWQPYDPWQTTKGILAVLVLIGLFFTSLPREISAISIAGLLLCSRKMKTRDIMGLVDWHLITLFCALFVIIHGISMSGYLDIAMERLARNGLDLLHPAILTGISAVLSNLFSNVPATMVLLKFLDPSAPVQWYILAVSSTFAGNLFLLGSIANLIVVEQASAFGIRITFRQHAAVGIPVAALSLLALLGWEQIA